MVVLKTLKILKGDFRLELTSHDRQGVESCQTATVSAEFFPPEVCHLCQRHSTAKLGRQNVSSKTVRQLLVVGQSDDPASDFWTEKRLGELEDGPHAKRKVHQVDRPAKRVSCIEKDDLFARFVDIISTL